MGQAAKRKQTKRQQFAKLPQELLTEANEALQAELRGLRTEMFQRAMPVFADTITVLNRLIEAAEGGDKHAQELLRAYFSTVARAQKAAGDTAHQSVHFEAPTRPEGWSSTDPDFHPGAQDLSDRTPQEGVVHEPESGS